MSWKSLAAKYRLIAPAGAMEQVGTGALVRDWTFRPSSPDLRTLWRRWLARRHRAAMPAWEAIRPVAPRPRWIVYFIYLTDGGLSDAHRFTLARLRADGAGLAVVCATPRRDMVPAELLHGVDALYWKALPGFDFSAYAVALGEVARHSPGADVLVLNDSVFGPFVPVAQLWSAMRWDLTGLTASGQVENHIQSYAFMLRDWNAAKLSALRSIFPQDHAFDDYRHVVAVQETRFARTAARTMSVGALWYGEVHRCADPTIFAAQALVAAGFPFVKRGLISKHVRFVDRDAILALLRAMDHPVARTL